VNPEKQKVMKLLPEPLLDGRRRDYTIEMLIEGTPADPTAPEERRLLNLVVPPWQRQEVWSTDQKTRFIEGIFLGLGTGYYVINGQDWSADGKSLPMSGWLLDGQQRLSSIRDFLMNALPIFDGIVYSDLDRPTAIKRFLRHSFPCFEIDYTSNEHKLKDLYERLNFGGTAHTADDRVAFEQTPSLRVRIRP